jgi:hypothetical protein
MTLIKVVIGALILAQLIIAAPVWAACQGASPNLTAVSANQIDINSCLSAAANGDTIVVPAGSATWTSTLAITKFVKLITSGTVIITDNSAGGDPSAGGGPSLVSITESTAGNTKIQGFVFQQGTGVHQGGSGIIDINYASGGQPILITGNTFAQGGSGNAIVARTNRGVISNNTFTGIPVTNNCFNNTSALRHKPSGLSSSWATPANFGSADTDGAQNLYFETNTVKNMLEAIDVDDNGRLIVRYNTFTNSAVGTHGNDTSAFGGRYYEAYNNNFVSDTTPVCPGGLPTNVNFFLTLRGGTALIHDNVIQRLSNAAWGSKSEVAFTVEMPRRNAGAFACWGTATPGGYPAPRQAGWGYTTGRTQAGATGVFQDVEAVYLWNNSGDGNYNSPVVMDYAPNECGAAAPSAANLVVAGRDYFTSTAKPGYTPYTYPHPLTGGVSAPPPTAGVPPPAPTSAVPPPAPTGLTVR